MNHDSAQSQHYESPCFPDDPESDESSFKKKLDQMLVILNVTFNKEEDNSKSISVIEKQLEQIAEQLNLLSYSLSWIDVAKRRNLVAHA